MITKWNIFIYYFFFMNRYCALTGLINSNILFHRASPCANILRPFRAEKFNVLFHRASPCANILRPFRAEKFNVLIVLQLNLSQFFTP